MGKTLVSNEPKFLGFSYANFSEVAVGDRRVLIVPIMAAWRICRSWPSKMLVASWVPTGSLNVGA